MRPAAETSQGVQLGPRHANPRLNFHPPPPPPLPSTPARSTRSTPASAERRQTAERRFREHPRSFAPVQGSSGRDGQRRLNDAAGSSRSRDTRPRPAPRMGLSRRETLREADTRRRQSKATAFHSSKRRSNAGKRDREEATERGNKPKEVKDDKGEEPETKKSDTTVG